MQSHGSPWETSEAEIKQKFDWEKVRLINDLTATALAVPLLQEHELHTLNAMRAEPGNIGVIAPGTGLGISLLMLVGGKLEPSASEGGHADFAPKNEDEVDLWRYLRYIHGHVSVERLVSGPGISAIYSWLKERDHYNEPAWFIEKMKLNDPPAVISEAALVEKLEPCIKTLKLSCDTGRGSGKFGTHRDDRRRHLHRRRHCPSNSSYSQKSRFYEGFYR